jgi:acyl-CoA dehydrogenase
MIRDSVKFSALLAEVRQFIRTECIPLEEQIDRSDDIPEPLVPTAEPV